MADHQPTVDDQPTDMSPTLRRALDRLFADAGPAPEPVAVQPSKVSACDEFAANRPSRPRIPRGGQYPQQSTVVRELYPGAGADHTLDPDFLGDSPVREDDGTCSFCGDPWHEHWDREARKYIDGREWHRRDNDGRGFYADEIPIAGAR